MANFHICYPGHGCDSKRSKSNEYEPGTAFTFRGLFTFIDEPVTKLTVHFA